MSTDTDPKRGTFEYIERKIRTEATVNELGNAFEWLCKEFLLTAPEYRDTLKNVWH